MKQNHINVTFCFKYLLNNINKYFDNINKYFNNINKYFDNINKYFDTNIIKNNYYRLENYEEYEISDMSEKMFTELNLMF